MKKKKMREIVRSSICEKRSKISKNKKKDVIAHDQNLGEILH